MNEINKKVTHRSKLGNDLLADVNGSAIKWWNSFTKAERRELRIKQIGETAFWNSFTITVDEIVDLYLHCR